MSCCVDDGSSVGCLQALQAGQVTVEDYFMADMNMDPLKVGVNFQHQVASSRSATPAAASVSILLITICDLSLQDMGQTSRRYSLQDAGVRDRQRACLAAASDGALQNQEQQALS
jgi:hypothetical protein